MQLTAEQLSRIIRIFLEINGNIEQIIEKMEALTLVIKQVRLTSVTYMCELTIRSFRKCSSLCISNTCRRYDVLSVSGDLHE